MEQRRIDGVVNGIFKFDKEKNELSLTDDRHEVNKFKILLLNDTTLVLAATDDLTYTLTDKRMH